MFIQKSSSSASIPEEEVGNNDGLANLDCSLSLEKSNSSLIMKITTHVKELFLIFAFLLTTFATIQNNSQKSHSAVAPSPFFARGSLIEDYYYGQHLSACQTKVGLSQLSFVFYYAPWSKESRHARKAYEHVSRLFYKEAYFGAINCWQPGSECRSQYSKIAQWPILMAYQSNGLGVQYKKNLWTIGALSSFINLLIHPFERLIAPEDLMDMMSSRDCVVVAFLNMESYSRHFKAFQRTASRFIERNPFNEVGFGIVIGETAMEFGVDQVPTLRAYMWNETIEYDGNNTWSSRDIISWINKNVQQVTTHLSPPGTKSSSIAPYIKAGPLLILFTPRNFYFKMDSYMMLKQLGMEYYNCKDDEWVHEVARNFLFQKRLDNREDLKVLQEECREKIKKNQYFQKCSSSASVSYLNVLNLSKSCEEFKNVDSFCEIDERKIGCGEEEVSHTKYSYKANRSKEKYQTSMLDNSEDENSPESIKKYNFQRQCEMLRQAERKDDILFINDPDSYPLEFITGLGCKSNKTLTLISMDSNNFHTFAERLGVDILEMENKTAAMIMDQENESTYLLDEPVSLNSLSRFLYTYHQGRLKRFLRTNSVQYEHTHFFNLNEFLNVKKEENIIRNTERDKRICIVESEKQKDRHVVIREINSEHFDTDVVKSNKTIVILFYSTNCAFCSVISHSALTVSKILYQMPEIEFLRIDGNKNDLPWHYTMAEYPSLLIFPAHSKTESRKFPSNMSKTVKNILAFVLANLNRSHRLLGLIKACNYKRQFSTYDCITTLQEEITNTISFALREWRKHSRRRSAILRIIKKLNEIYLKLFKIQNSCDFIEIERDVVKIDMQWQKAF